jgi:hypothetical protein
MFANRTKAPSGPAHVEIFGELLEALTFHRRFAAACVAFAFVALATASYCTYLALYRPLAFVVDGDGQATFVGRLREQAGPAQAEVVYVAKEFLRRYVAFNSATVESDFAEAWNMMTSELRQQEQRLYADYEKQNHQTLAEAIKAQGIQTALELEDPRTKVTDHNSKVFTVHVQGTVTTWPLNRSRDDAASKQHDIESLVTLVRCPRTTNTPNGLLVAKVTTHVFDVKPSEAAPTAPPPPPRSK